MGYRGYGRQRNYGLAFFGFLLLIPAMFWTGFRVYNGIDYDRKIEGYLKRAADANTVPLAEKQLSIAIEEIERRGWTEGSTHVIYSTPGADVGFWYDNLKASQNELRSISPDSSQLEQTNVLMKLRETILDEGGESLSVTSPGGISVFPNNAAYFWGGWVVLIVGCIGALMVVVVFHD